MEHAPLPKRTFIPHHSGTSTTQHPPFTIQHSDSALQQPEDLGRTLLRRAWEVRCPIHRRWRSARVPVGSPTTRARTKSSRAAVPRSTKNGARAGSAPRSRRPPRSRCFTLRSANRRRLTRRPRGPRRRANRSRLTRRPHAPRRRRPGHARDRPSPAISPRQQLGFSRRRTCRGEPFLRRSGASRPRPLTTDRCFRVEPSGGRRPSGRPPIGLE